MFRSFRWNAQQSVTRQTLPISRARYWRSLGALSATVLLGTMTARAADSNLGGHISRVTFVQDYLLIMLDSGFPTNCAGTAFGWMMVSAEKKPMLAFVTGLWMRGDAASKPLFVYTNPTDGSGFCQVTQIDTLTAG